MKARLIRSTLLIVLVAGVTLGGPLLALARHQVWTSADQRLGQQATALAAEYEDTLSAGRLVDLTDVQRQLPGDRVVVELSTGRTESSGPPLTGPVRTSRVDVPGGAVIVQTSASPTIAKARQATLLVIALAALAAIAAVFLAIRQARRLARPLDGLAAHAAALGAGDYSHPAVASGVPEIDAIAHVLDRSGSRIDALVSVQREFAGDAAHQLRTPLTGIALRLDEIVGTGDRVSAVEAEAALNQVDRLNRVITALLARARGDAAAPTVFDLAVLVSHEAVAYRELLAADERPVRLQIDGVASVSARHEHIAGVVTCLLDNALVHGQGAVDIRLAHAGDEVCVTVADEGLGIPAALCDQVFTRAVSGTSGTGIGLSLARSLAAGEGGSLELSSCSPAALILRLPLAAHDPVPAQ